MLSGKVVSGLGQGKLFFSLAQYSQGFERLLERRPYPGTLNIDIGEKNAEICGKLKLGAKLVVGGFEEGGKKYFDVKCIRARLNGVAGLIIFPCLNHHPKNILEFACHENLRERFSLTDGSEVEIEI